MHVLVIEDDPTFRHLLSTYLARNGHQVSVAEDGFSGLREARKDHPDLIITDYRLPDVDGLVVAEWLAESTTTADTPMIVLTAAEPDEVATELASQGVLDVLFKQTLTEAQLTSAIEKAFSTLSSTESLFPGEETNSTASTNLAEHLPGQ